jgi:hypothetical protein
MTTRKISLAILTLGLAMPAIACNRSNDNVDRTNGNMTGMGDDTMNTGMSPTPANPSQGTTGGEWGDTTRTMGGDTVRR